MRIAVYLSGNVRALARSARAAGLACRWHEPALWPGTVVPGHACYAPGSPHIRAAYAAAGLDVLDALPSLALAAEDDSPLPADVCSIIIACPGPHLLESLQKYPLDADLTIAVNHAAAYIDADWWVALDDHTHERVQGVQGNPTLIIPDTAKAPPRRRYRRLSSLGRVSQSGLSIIAAITAAASLRPQTIFIYGADWIPGAGIDGGTTNRGADRWASERAAVERLLDALAADGIATYRMHPDAPATAYLPPSATPAPDPAPHDGTPLTELSGIGPRLAETITRATGCATVEALADRCSTSAGRQEMVGIRGISLDALRAWFGPLDDEEAD